MIERQPPEDADQGEAAEGVRSWRRLTAELARHWALVLAEGMPGQGGGLLAALVREIEAYACQLLRNRWRSRGVSLDRWIGADLMSRWCLAEPDDSAPLSGLLSAGTDDPERADEAASGGWLAPAGRGPSYRRTVVTRGDFERFCRWTGMDPGCLTGDDEQQAGLVFYLVVFAMLTGPGGSPDRPGLELFKKLRACREQLTRHAASLGRDQTSSPASAAKGTVAQQPGPGCGEGGSFKRANDSVIRLEDRR